MGAGRLVRVPELPDITIYLEAIESRVLEQTLIRARVASPFLLRTVAPPLTGLEGQRVTALRRVGKRIAIGFDNEQWLVMHLMIAGRPHWRGAGGGIGWKKHTGPPGFAAGPA